METELTFHHGRLPVMTLRRHVVALRHVVWRQRSGLWGVRSGMRRIGPGVVLRLIAGKDVFFSCENLVPSSHAS